MLEEADKLKYYQQYYQDHKEQRKAYNMTHAESIAEGAKVRGRNNRDKLIEHLNKWKADRGCEICEYKNADKPWRFDTHHIDPSTKVGEITKIRSLKRLIEELKKCICVCVMCHRDIHHTS